MTVPIFVIFVTPLCPTSLTSSANTPPCPKSFAIAAADTSLTGGLLDYFKALASSSFCCMLSHLSHLLASAINLFYFLHWRLSINGIFFAWFVLLADQRN